MLGGVISDMIERCGVDCTVYDIATDSERSIKALIDPFRYRYGDYASDHIESGEVDERRYLCITSATCDLSQLMQGSLITANGRDYRIDTSEMYRFGSEAVYCRTILRAAGGREL